jgi:small subunit ribosomal protein S2
VNRTSSRPTIPDTLANQAAEEAAKRIPAEYQAFIALEQQTAHLGAVNHVRYFPERVLREAPADATLELLMASQAHMGHHTSLWNPATSRYIYGVRAGIHIISLEVTLAHLRRAARLVEEVAYHGGLILFVGTRKGQMPIVVRAAELAKACHLFQKWTPGAITNRDRILHGMGMQVVDEKDQPLAGFEKHIQGRRAVLPDLVVCFNPLENNPMLRECGQANIPTIGVIDTNADPSWVTYAIPANDDRWVGSYRQQVYGARLTCLRLLVLEQSRSSQAC